jgi:hypothetical protein
MKDLFVRSCFFRLDAYFLWSSFVGEVLSALLALGIMVYVACKSGICKSVYD